MRALVEACEAAAAAAATEVVRGASEAEQGALEEMVQGLREECAGAVQRAEEAEGARYVLYCVMCVCILYDDAVCCLCNSKSPVSGIFCMYHRSTQHNTLPDHNTLVPQHTRTTTHTVTQCSSGCSRWK